jgi:hypothetical protein
LPEPVGPVTSRMPCGLLISLSRICASRSSPAPAGPCPACRWTHEQAQADALAVDRRHGGHAHVDFLAVDAQADAAVLRQALLGDVHVAHDLDAGNDGGLEPLQLRRHRGLVQHAVHPVADAQVHFLRLQMNVGRAVLVGFPDDLVHELDHGGFLVQLAEVLLAQVLLGGDLDAAVLHHAVQGFAPTPYSFLAAFSMSPPC